MTEFADDIAFVCSKDNMPDMLHSIQGRVNSIKTLCEGWGMEINIDKTMAMLFTHKRETSPKITLKGVDIEFVRNLNF